jgi:hypothetical protein
VHPRHGRAQATAGVFVVGESAARAVASRRRERGLHELSGVTIAQKARWPLEEHLENGRRRAGQTFIRSLPRLFTGQAALAAVRPTGVRVTGFAIVLEGVLGGEVRLKVQNKVTLGRHAP